MIQMNTLNASPRFGSLHFYQIGVHGDLYNTPYTARKKTIDTVLETLQTAVPDSYSKIVVGQSDLYLGVACFDKDDRTVMQILGERKPVTSDCHISFFHEDVQDTGALPINNQRKFTKAKDKINSYASPSEEWWSDNDNKLKRLAAKLNTVA